MKIAELVKISMEMLKMMSKCGIKTDDWQHLERKSVLVTLVGG